MSVPSLSENCLLLRIVARSPPLDELVSKRT